MTATPIEHDANPLGPNDSTEGIEEYLEAGAINARHEQEEACAGARFDRGIQPAPGILVLDDPRRPYPGGTPATLEPDLEAEPPFIDGPGATATGVAQRLAEVTFCTRPARLDPPGDAAVDRSYAGHVAVETGPRRR